MLCVMSRHTDATLTLLQYSNWDDWGQICRSVPGYPTELLGHHSVLDPPDPIPNSEVKRNCADDSVGSPHVKVGHCQALTPKPRTLSVRGFFCVQRDRLLNMDNSPPQRWFA